MPSRQLAVLLFTAFSCLPVAAEETDRAEDAEALTGTWRAVEGVFDGEQLNEEQLDEFKLVFGKFRGRREGRLALGPPLVPADERPGFGGFPCYLDVTKSPPVLSFTRSLGFHVTHCYGIYQLQGERLKISLDLVPTTHLTGGGNLRRILPADFSLPRGKGFALLTLKRVAPKNREEK